MATKKRKAKKAKGKPDKSVVNGRDPKTQQFLPGNDGGPGRPKGIDYRKAVEDYATKHGIDIKEAIGEATVAMIAQAKGGDVQAMKLLFDRNCGLLKQELEIQSTTTIYLPDQARADLREMAKDKDLQAIQRAELVRRTNGQA